MRLSTRPRSRCSHSGTRVVSRAANTVSSSARSVLVPGRQSPATYASPKPILRSRPTRAKNAAGRKTSNTGEVDEPLPITRPSGYVTRSGSSDTARSKRSRATTALTGARGAVESPCQGRVDETDMSDAFLGDMGGPRTDRHAAQPEPDAVQADERGDALGHQRSPDQLLQDRCRRRRLGSSTEGGAEGE